MAKEENPNLDISKSYVKNWLAEQASYTRFKKWNNPKHYRHTFVRDFDQLQMDLVFMPEKYKDENDALPIILVTIEILSRYCFAKSIRNKSGEVVKKAIKEILEEYRKRFKRDNPKAIQFDEGNEFLSNEVKSFLENESIDYFFTYSPRKASIVERLNRTLKTKTMRMFEKNKNHVWNNYLEDIVGNYNDTRHRSIGIKPKDVSDENKFEVWGRLFGHQMQIKKPKYKTGDEVRVLKLNTRYRVAQLIKEREHKKFLGKQGKTFGDFLKEKYKDKDEEKILNRDQHAVETKRPPFSKEIFRIEKVLLGDPNVYKLYSDEADVEVLGIFYEEELSLIKKE